MNDKALHGAAGAAIGIAVGFLISPYVGFGLAVAAGVAKEAWDYASKKGTPDIGDISATFIGGGFGAFVASIL